MAIYLRSLSGALLVGSCLNVALFMLEIALFLRYLSGRPTRLGRHWAVAIIVNDTFFLMAVSASAWMYLIEFPANGTVTQTWPFPLMTISKSIAALLEHICLINWFYALSNNIILTTILGLFTGSHVACHLTAVVYMFKFPAPPLAGFNSSSAALTPTAFTLAVTVDVLVATGLAWQLARLQTVFTGMKSIVHRFFICTVVSGTFTAIVGTVFLITFWTNTVPGPPLVFIMEKIYGITVLVNLVFVQVQRDSSPPTQTSDLNSSLWSAFFRNQQTSEIHVDSSSEKPIELDDLTVYN